MSSKLSILLSKVVLGGLALYFIYVLFQVIGVVNRRHISTDGGVYINSTSQNQELRSLANTLTVNCSDDSCRVQKLLDYVTNIPYKINNYNAHKPEQTIQNNIGDCDDKSNLLISLLHELKIESYFVLVPEHIFVIVSLPKIAHKKALYLENKPYYILESTAKNSRIGFPLQYTLNEISDIIEPFKNHKLNMENIKYK